MWSSDESACRLALVYAALGAVAMVCVAPVLWRGTDLQTALRLRDELV